MEFKLVSSNAAATEADALVLPVFKDETCARSPLKEFNSASGGLLTKALGEIGSKCGSVISWPVDGLGAKRLIVVQLGERNGLAEERLRQAYGAGGRAALKFKEVAVVLRNDNHAQAASDGFVSAAFDPALFKTKKEESNDEPKAAKNVTTKVVGGRAAAKGIERGRALAESVSFARHLVTLPANELGPEELASKTKAELTKVGVKVEVLTGKKLEKFGGLNGVSQGSDRPGVFITMVWDPPKAKKGVHLGLVGKGVTFDSGGLSIKTTAGMTTMKGDMAGAAAVIGAMRAIAALNVAVKVTAVCPATDNLPSSTAMKGGDVLRMYSGSTVEILNTDAEGRLILADGLAWIAQRGVTHIVDVATLTGASAAAFGGVYFSVIGRPDNFVTRTIRSSSKAGERGWQLPLTDQYRAMIRSDIADIKNTGSAVGGGAISAAMFLEHFVPDDIPWAHFDIAGCEFGEAKAWTAKGATGVGLRTLFALAEDISGGKAR